MDPLKTKEIIVTADSPEIAQIIARHFVAGLNRSKEWRCMTPQQFISKCRERSKKASDNTL